MTTANTDAGDLAAAVLGGLVREDAMEKIWDISGVPLPFTDRVGSGSVTNPRFSWTIDKLAAPVVTGQVVDGADTTTGPGTLTTRVNNFCEERVKSLGISTRSEVVNSIGNVGSMAYQTMQRLRELKRDVEATCLSNNASRADDGNTNAGRTGALDAWLVTNTSNGASTGANGGFSTTTGLVTGYTAGTKRALNETIFKDLLQAVYLQGGDAMVVMSRPQVIRKFSEYQFSSGARVATMTKDNEGAAGPGTVLAAVNVYISDWGTVEIVPNRLQLDVAAGYCTLFILDMALLEISYLQNYKVQPLAKTGLSERAQMVVDFGLRVGNEAGLAAYRDIDYTLAMTT